MHPQGGSSVIKPVILVCGANYSGTSMVAKFLIDNGGYCGETDRGFSTSIPYPRYEDKFFHDFCRRALQLEQGVFNKQEIVDYIAALPDDKVVILKYPKAVYLSEGLYKLIQRPIKMVYVIRSYGVVITSAMAKNSSEFTVEYNYNMQSYDIGVRYPGEYYPAIFERLLRHRELDKLLEFCELHPEEINTKAIKPGMVTYGVSEW